MTVQEIQTNGHIGKRGKEVFVVMPECFNHGERSTTCLPFMLPKRDNQFMRIICDANKSAVFMDDALVYDLFDAGNKKEEKQ